MKKLVSGVLATALLLAAAPENASSFTTFGCYDQEFLGVEQHEVWGGGNWVANPHGWLFYQCQAVHWTSGGGPGGGPRVE
jgi:hypothetical protein